MKIIKNDYSYRSYIVGTLVLLLNDLYSTYYFKNMDLCKRRISHLNSVLKTIRN